MNPHSVIPGPFNSREVGSETEAHSPRGNVTRTDALVCFAYLTPKLPHQLNSWDKSARPQRETPQNISIV
jgi:hypothetical protein